MTPIPPEHRITDVAALERLYGAPSGAAVEKELDYTAPALLQRFAMDGRLPRSVIAVSVDTVFVQRSRAIWRFGTRRSRSSARAFRAWAPSSPT